MTHDEERGLPNIRPALAPLLTTSNLSKRFPGVVAVDAVNVAVYEGEIVALLGQNGAGKSTLIQILAGVHPHGSYDGAIELAGTNYQPLNVLAAESAGVVLIPQEIHVVPDLTVGENMMLNNEPTHVGLVDRPALFARAGEALTDFSVDIDPFERMGSLDLATQQLVVIARALSKRARLLILDEPTAALTESEAQRLFERMRGLRDRGVTSIFVSHRLAEVFAVADRVLVMRDGRLTGDHQIHATTQRNIVSEMIGGSLVELAERASPKQTPVLKVRDLTVYDADEPARKHVESVGFDLHEAEILGLFGLVGAGCSATAMALFGAWPGRIESRIQVRGSEVSITRPADAIGLGIGLMAQDRRSTLIQDHSIADNIVLASLPSISQIGFLDFDRKNLIARKYVDMLHIRTTSTGASIATLSGGNQQKVQVGRWLAAGSTILLLVDPTRGVDVGARAEINRLWQQLAREGYSMFLVSSEAEELRDVCHRILVMRGGRIVAEFPGQSVSEAELLAAAAGV